jgi:hypothetical protein
LTTGHRGTLFVSTLKSWLWDAACQVRGPLDTPKFKDYILPLIFLKRLSDVFEDEMTQNLMFVGVNPGGSSYGHPIESVEEGNAYRIEHWGKGNEPNPLQIQVRGLYELLSEKLGQPSVDNIMD